MNFASRSTMFFAFGPGSSVINRGNFIFTSAVVIIFILLGTGPCPSSAPLRRAHRQFLWREETAGQAQCAFMANWIDQSPRRHLPEKRYLVYAVEVRTQFGGRTVGRELQCGMDSHLRFQRTPPSFE